MIQAYVDGYRICDAAGLTISSYAFDMPVSFYRIKSKPDPFKELKEAYERGEKIQFFSEMRNEWHDLYNPSWASCYIYRIKPKVKWVTLSTCSFVDIPERYRIKPEPKLVPFDFSDRKVLIGKEIMGKKSESCHIITEVLSDRVKVSGVYYSFIELLCAFVAINDGSPCGKYVECE